MLLCALCCAMLCFLFFSFVGKPRKLIFLINLLNLKQNNHFWPKETVFINDENIMMKINWVPFCFFSCFIYLLIYFFYVYIFKFKSKCFYLSCFQHFCLLNPSFDKSYQNVISSDFFSLIQISNEQSYTKLCWVMDKSVTRTSQCLA